jgi:lipoyl(octanoyl) transferase
MRPVRARLVPYGRFSGDENMAADEYLLTSFERWRVPVLRLYGWDPPAISLGRYQGAGCVNIEACRRDGVSVVRRITGGGAIFHDREITYSIACGSGFLDEKRHSVAESFEKLNRFIIDMYRGLGLEAAYARDAAPRPVIGPPPAFCFSGNEDYDIIIGGRKIGGNAQRRKGEVIFQHGSIPLSIDTGRITRYFNTSIGSMNFTSLNEAAGRDVPEAEAVSRLAESFMKCLGCELESQDLGEDDLMEIRSIIEKKYARDEWNLEGRWKEDEGHQAGMA